MLISKELIVISSIISILYRNYILIHTTPVDPMVDVSYDSYFVENSFSIIIMLDHFRERTELSTSTLGVL